ncbi:MAG: hypothetical protein FWD72_04600 [Eggerthellaceae bacterium]|nr:hypothetical protein [Eggerthellaceae bacterium]
MNQAKFDEKKARLDATIALTEPDRVPFSPKVGHFYCEGYGVHIYEAMKDLRTVFPGVLQFLKDYDPDLVWSATTYSIDALDALGSLSLRRPGPGFGIPLDASFQFIDQTNMLDDEFDEFLRDPTHFTLTKLLPRRYSNLQPFSKLFFGDLYERSTIQNLSVFAQDDVRKALYAMVRAGEAASKMGADTAEIGRIIAEEGYPAIGASFYTPFDIYADFVRGLIQATMDVIERPEATLEVVNRIADLYIDHNIAAAAARGDKYAFMPLHAGVDEFMSVANYEKFYWPGLKRIMMALIDHGITPYVFCEGKYNTRLEVLSDVPKGKVVYLFEEVDEKRTKDVLGKVACIGGNLPSALLAFGTKQQVIDETKRLIDIFAPGGGFIMDCSITLDNATHENMRAWQETTLEYGVY